MSANHKRNNCIVIILIKLEKYRINLAGASLTFCWENYLCIVVSVFPKSNKSFSFKVRKKVIAEINDYF